VETLQISSIILEAMIIIIALTIALGKKKLYGLGFALTFAIYVYYDLAKFLEWQTLPSLLPILFFIATLSAMLSMIGLLRKS
jgi:hypothetical protein